MASAESSLLVARATQAHADVRALPLDERLERAARARRTLAAVGLGIVDEAVRECAQTVRFARRELASALDFLAALPSLVEAIRPRPVPALAGETLLEWAPYGVVLGWHAANSPIWVPALVATSALVGGNAVLARPSRRTRATSGMVLAALAGPWPEHALQMVAMDPQEAEALLVHPGVHAVVAHASTATAKRQIARLAAAYAEGAPLRPYIAEASGNDPAVVLADADPAAAARAVAVGAFTNAGQLCMAAKRIIVERGIWDAFRPHLAREVGRLVLGDPGREETDVGPFSGPGAGWARTALAEALALGGEVVVGEGERGPFFTPTVVLLPHEARETLLWREESFAPLRGLMLAEGPEEAVALANDSPFGLGAAVFGGAGAARVAAGVRAARVVINESPLYADPHLVVGGVGDSGFGGARPKLEQLVYARRVHRGGSGA